MTRDRRALLVLGCVAVTLFAASCSDDGGSSASTDSVATSATGATTTPATSPVVKTTTTTTTTSSTTGTAAATTTAAPTTTQAPPSSNATGPLVVDLDVDAIIAAGAPRVITVVAESQMEINLMSASSREYHLHGYDLEATAPAGKEVTMAFTAGDKGEFELETHGTSKVLLILKVV